MLQEFVDMHIKNKNIKYPEVLFIEKKTRNHSTEKNLLTRSLQSRKCLTFYICYNQLHDTVSILNIYFILTPQLL